MSTNDSRPRWVRSNLFGKAPGTMWPFLSRKVVTSVSSCAGLFSAMVRSASTHRLRNKVCCPLSVRVSWPSFPYRKYLRPVRRLAFLATHALIRISFFVWLTCKSASNSSVVKRSFKTVSWLIAAGFLNHVSARILTVRPSRRAR
jgi:hypothetical protein